MADQQREVILKLPADKEFVLLARMTLSGLGMIAGLDVDLIDDLGQLLGRGEDVAQAVKQE